MMLALIGLNAALVSLEVALAALDPVAVARDRDHGTGRARSRARAVASLLDRRGAVVSSAQLGITACSLGLGVLAVPVLGSWVDRPTAWWVVAVALSLTVLVHLVLGELVPTTVGTARPDTVSRWLARPASAMVTVLGPLTSGLARAAQRIALRAGASDAPLGPEVRNREALRRLVSDSEEDGTISHQDAELLQRTLRLGDKIAADALTPRVAIEALPVDTTVGNLIERSGATGLSRFPVEGDDLDDIVGVVHVKDVLSVPLDRRVDAPLIDLVRPVLAVPESKPLEALMVQLQAETGQFALVVDEYGGTAGIITLEDLLEEIVGEIDDEHDPARRGPSVRRWAGAHLLSGRLHPDEVREACGFEMPDGDFETLGGFVMSRRGAIPEVGDVVDVEGWSVEVVSMDGHRVATLRVVAPAPGTFGGHR